MKKQIGISQRIQQATTVTEVAKLNRELQSYRYASPSTKAHAKRRADARVYQLFQAAMTDEK